MEPTQVDSPRLSATPIGIAAGERLSGRLPPTWSDGLFVPGGQGVAGSNPAVPTGKRSFSDFPSGARSGAQGFSFQAGFLGRLCGFAFMMRFMAVVIGAEITLAT
jgi:hypothetical protein